MNPEVDNAVAVTRSKLVVKHHRRRDGAERDCLGAARTRRPAADRQRQGVARPTVDGSEAGAVCGTTR